MKILGGKILRGAACFTVLAVAAQLAVAENQAASAGKRRAAALAARKAAVAEKKTAALEDGNTRKRAHKAAMEEKKSERKDKWDAARKEKLKKKEEIQNKAQERIDKRQTHQARRIEHGITKGYLADGEVAKLNAQQQAIASLETQIFSDGKLTRDEFLSIRTELNTASRYIWGEKHDADGGQMAVYRLGKNVFAKSSLTGKLADENLSQEEARVLMKDFRRAVELKTTLSAGDLSAGERAGLQAEYNNLLNKYFEVRGM